MPKINKNSIKVELDPSEYENDFRTLFEETFYEAIEQMSFTTDMKGMDFMLSKFFTVRFDRTKEGAVAATITATSKRN
jgi:hypothetical protein